MNEMVLENLEEPRVLRRVVQLCPDAVIISRVEATESFGVVIYVNDAFERLTGYAASEVLGHLPGFLDQSLTDPQQCRRIREALQRGQKLSTQLVGQHRNGDALHFELHVAPVVNADTQITHFVAIQRELPERRRRSADEKAQLFDAVMESTLDGLGVMESLRDDNGDISDFRIRFMNRRMGEIVHCPVDRTLGHGLLEMFPGVREEGLFDAYCGVIETGRPFHTEIAYQHEGLDAIFRIEAVRIGDGVMLTLSDISDFKHREVHLQRRQREAQWGAMHDPLTQLPNRSYLFDYLKKLELTDPPEWYALVMIDLDYFKALNDALGHAAGDAALNALAEVLIHTMRQEDFVARIGGDEFVAVLHLGDKNAALAAQLTNRLLEGAQRVLPAPASASAGFSLWCTADAVTEDVMAEADRAMYANKRGRR